MGGGSLAMELATHTPFVPQGVPPVSKPFDLIASTLAIEVELNLVHVH